MKWKNYVFPLLFIALSQVVQAQTKIRLPLTIGDTLPEITIDNILNYNSNSIQLSRLKGKAIVLDFFATWCGSCVEALPKLDSLQKAFPDKLQIFVVDYEFEDPQKVKVFLKKNPIGQHIALPFITSDTILAKYFPHRVVPHEIWIDGHGIIQAITSGYYVNTANIRSLIAGRKLNLPLKEDIISFDYHKPLFTNGNGGERLLFRSTLGRYIPGAGSISGTRKGKNSIRTFTVNWPILTLYNKAIEGGLRNRYVLEVIDSSRFIYDASIPPDEWNKANCYCYEMITPPNLSPKALKHHMLNDLNNYFGLNGRSEIRIMNYWALCKTNAGSPWPKTDGGQPVKRFYKDSSLAVFKNQPLSAVINVLNVQKPSAPRRPIIIDETHYNGNVDIFIKTHNIHAITMPELRRQLHKYGLNLVQKRKPMEVFVITANGYHSSSRYHETRE